MGDKIDLILSIEGMTCSSCAKNIENVLTKLEVVSDAVINFANEELRLVNNESIINLDGIM